MNQFDCIRFEIEGAIARIALRRPDAAHGLNSQMARELKQAAKLCDQDPQIKVVVSSGYANDPIMANYKAYGFCGVVPKPYKIHELSATFGRILNERMGEAAH